MLWRPCLLGPRAELPRGGSPASAGFYTCIGVFVGHHDHDRIRCYRDGMNTASPQRIVDRSTGVLFGHRGRSMGWLSGLAWCSAGFGALGVAFGALLFVFQDKLLYLPQAPIRDPDDNPNGEMCTWCNLGHCFL